MSEPFLGEIRLMSFNFAPRGWAMCDGQILPISQNQSLYSLLGTIYGGDGRTNFALPDLRERVPVHVGTGHALGERGGAATHALSIGEMPQHTHRVAASTATTGGSASPNNGFLGGGNNVYRPGAGTTTFSAATVESVGGSPHPNLQPYLVVTFCIALQGLFPSRN